MSVLLCEPVKAVGGIGNDGHLTANAFYRVQTSDHNDGWWTVVMANGLPRRGDSYSFGNDSNPYLFCATRTPSLADEDSNRKEWMVNCGYTTKPIVGFRDVFESPLDEPWKKSGSYVRGSKLVNKNKNGQRLKVSSHEGKIVEVPAGHDTIHLEGPTTAIDLLIRAQAIYRVNQTAMWGLQARMLLMTAWEWEERWFGSTPYVYHSIDFEVNYDKWNEVYLDAGLFEYRPSNTGMSKWIRITDGTGMPVNEPYPLNGAGVPLAPGSTNFTYLTEEVILESDFLSIGFPNPLPGPFV